MTSYHKGFCPVAGLTVVLTLYAPFATAATMSSGPAQGDWLVRAGMARIEPVGMRATIPTIGGDVETSAVTLPTLDISYFLTDHWALQVTGGVSSTSYQLTDSAIGDFDIGTVKTAALAVMAQYHFRPRAAINPYLGAGMVHSHALRVDPADNVPNFEVESINSVLLGAGLDYHLSGHWFANASVQYLWVPTYHFEGEGFSAEVDVDTIITGFGLGYRF